MPTLRFTTGQAERVAFNLPAAANFTGAFTLATLVRRRSIGAWHALINHGPAALNATPQPNFEFNANNQPLLDTATPGIFASSGIIDVTNWYVLAVTKGAGTVQPIFHWKRIDDASAWQHLAGSGTNANCASQIGWRIVYGIWQGSDQADQNMALGAGWGSALTNLQIEALLTNKKTTDWTGHAIPPAYCHELTSKTTIPDLMGNGATLSEVTGTTLDLANDPPGWVFGIGPQYPPSVGSGIGLGKIGGGTIGIRAANAGDTTPPTVNVTSAGTGKISQVSGKDSYPYSFQANEAGQAWEIRVVPATNSLRAAGTVVESGGAHSANTTVSGSITGAELAAASAGQGAKIVKFFSQDLAGNWST